MRKRVLSVGQCGPDNATLKGFLTRHFDVDFDTSDQLADTLRQLRSSSYDLVLINRKLDADYSDGMEILRAIRREESLASTPVMIISNYAEAQEEAIAAGGVRGFGKLEYQNPETLERLRPYLAAASPATTE